MQTGYACVSCGHVYMDKIGRCDCSNGKFEYTEQWIIPKNKPANKSSIPLIESLNISEGVWCTDFSRSLNNVYTVNGNGRSIVAQCSSDGENVSKDKEILKANATLIRASKVMLETLMALEPIYRTRISVTGSDVARARHAMILHAIGMATNPEYKKGV